MKSSTPVVAFERFSDLSEEPSSAQAWKLPASKELSHHSQFLYFPQVYEEQLTLTIAQEKNSEKVKTGRKQKLAGIPNTLQDNNNSKNSVKKLGARETERGHSWTLGNMDDGRDIRLIFSKPFKNLEEEK